MADDSISQTVQDNQTSDSFPEVTSSPSQLSVTQVPSDSTSSDQSAGMPDGISGSDTNRPVSPVPSEVEGTIPADSQHVLPSDHSADTGNRPVSTIPADSPTDSSFPVQDLPTQSSVSEPQPPPSSQSTDQHVQEEVTKQADSVEPSIPPAPENTAPSESDTNRPVSTIPADSFQTTSSDQSAILENPIIPDATPSADLQQKDSIPESQSVQPVSTASSDSDQPVSTVQADTVATNPADSVQMTSSDQLVDTGNRPESIISTDLLHDVITKEEVPSKPVSTIPDDTGKNTGIPDNQAIQMQSKAPDDTSSDLPEISDDQSAGIQPEPSQPIQTAPSSPPENQDSGKSLSFGDILAGKTSDEPVQPSVGSQPEEDVQPTQAHSVSFGDLIKDINYSVQTVPEAERPIEQTIQSTPASPLPTTAPTSGQSPQPSQNPPIPQAPQTSSNPPLNSSTVSPDPVIVKKPIEVIKEVIKEVPVVDEVEVNKRAEEKINLEVDSRLHKATQKRIEKREENLNKIVQFLQSKPKANNNDIRDFLHVSQTTATEYLHTLVDSGKIRIEGKGRATFYHL